MSRSEMLSELTKMKEELAKRMAEQEAEEEQDEDMPQEPNPAADFAASLEEMSPKKIEDLFKEFYFKKDKTDSDEEEFKAISAALEPSAVLQRRLRQAAQATEDLSQRLQ